MYAAATSTLQRSQVESFGVVLEHDIDDQYSYTPGELMKGCVVIKLSHTIDVQAITLDMTGEGHVSLQADDGGTVVARETYISLRKVLFGHFPEGEAQSHSPEGEARSHTCSQLDKGTHELAFYWPLPDSIPSSFVGKHGGVSYLLKAALLPNSRFCMSALTASEPFMVRRECHAEPHRLLPEQLAAHKTVGGKCCSLFGLGPIKRIELMLCLDKTAFVPGGQASLKAKVNNGAAAQVTSLHAAIMMKTKFYANGTCTVCEQLICRTSCKVNILRGQEMCCDMKLCIPCFIPESGLPGCNIIDISYHLAFVAEADNKPESKKSIRMTYPVTISSMAQQKLTQRPAGVAREAYEQTWNETGHGHGTDVAGSNAQSDGQPLEHVSPHLSSNSNMPVFRVNPLFDTSTLSKHDAPFSISVGVLEDTASARAPAAPSTTNEHSATISMQHSPDGEATNHASSTYL